ncbi:MULTISPECIES: alpha/beta fold hydrolase [unclassified Leifsonia]|uniref:alpha/beta fold hydrolase n=1 Tax=unclassified Leifsonia TaxID=2663824 RepID=UPI0006FF6F1F|nr:MULTISPECIES: alpha/beta fold hydrolase [unclassified Leifsonia]KQX05801.1 lysophospholipase [Leifsonia sp. Root1293]KRA09436.1 lysophospholipase [Leifsonia sp. Root60]
MSSAARTFTDSHGIRIHFDVHDVPQPKAIVQLVHGVGEHAGRYRHVAQALNDAGYTVYADDHRGHGRTGMEQHGGDVAMLGRLGPGGLRATVAAVHQLTELIREENPETPVVLLGHSWGSLMAQIILNSSAADYAAAILTGTGYRMPGSVNSGDLNRRHKNLGTTGMEWLSRDVEVQQAFLDDPLTTSVPIAKLFGLVDGVRLYGRPAPDLPDIPVLIQVGGDDSVGGEKSALKLVDAYHRRSGLTDVTLIVYPEARHEIFNELNRADVLADTTAWLDEHLG